MQSKLTLQIPFILLGRRDCIDPKLCKREWRYVVHETLREHCTHIPVRLWTLGDINTKFEVESRADWMIPPTPSTERSSTNGSDRLPGYSNTDGVPTIDEGIQLGDTVCACPMLLLTSLHTFFH